MSELVYHSICSKCQQLSPNFGGRCCAPLESGGFCTGGLRPLRKLTLLEKLAKYPDTQLEDLAGAILFHLAQKDDFEFHPKNKEILFATLNAKGGI